MLREKIKEYIELLNRREQQARRYSTTLMGDAGYIQHGLASAFAQISDELKLLIREDPDVSS